MDEQNNQSSQHSQTPTPATQGTGNGQSHHSGGSPLEQLESWFDLYLGQKAPQLPENFRETLVKIAPYVTIVVMLIAIPLLLLALSALGIVAVASPVIASYTYFGPLFWVSILVLLASLVLEAMAIPGLFKRSIKAWRLLYWASLLAGVSNIIGFNIGSLIGTVIGLYILFQVKKLYR